MFLLLTRIFVALLLLHQRVRSYRRERHGTHEGIDRKTVRSVCSFALLLFCAQFTRYNRFECQVETAKQCKKITRHDGIICKVIKLLKNKVLYFMYIKLQNKSVRARTATF